MIAAGDLARRLADLEPIGLDERGTTRLAWTRRGRGRGRVVRPPRGGGRPARRGRPGRQPLGGARRAGAVVGRRLAPRQRARRRALRRRARACAPRFAVAEHAPVAVIAFADEEGARFNTPTFGSRALAGVLDPAVLERRDDDGVRLADAMAGRRRRSGRRRARRRSGSGACAASSSCTSTRPPTSSASPSCARLAARMRVQADLHGRADHAGHHAPPRALRRAAARRDPHRRRPPARHRRHGRHRVADARRAQRADDDRRPRPPVARRALGEPRRRSPPGSRTCPTAPSCRSPRARTASSSTPRCAPRSATRRASRASRATTRASWRRRSPRPWSSRATPAASATPPRRRPTSTTPPPPPRPSWRSCDEGGHDRRHAQRALARLPARPARAGRAQPRRLLVLAHADDAPRPGPRSRVDAARGHPGLRRDAGRGLRGGRRVPLRPPRPRRHALRRAQRAGARRRAGGDRGRPARSSSSPPPTTAAGTRASTTPTSRASWRASTRCASGPTGATASRSRWPRTRCARCRPTGWRRSPATPRDHGLPRHVHASEQPREVRDCRAQHGASPIELLARTGFLGPRTSVVHAIHVDERDVALLADSETIVITCPTTEGNLGDGHLPALAYRDAGRAAGHRLGLAGARRPLRGDARARDRRAPRGHHAPRAAGPPRRPVGRAGAQRPGQPRPAGRRRRSTSTSSTPTCAASAATSWRSRWPRAPRPASSPVRPAACAPAAAACRSGRPAPAPAGR